MKSLASSCYYCNSIVNIIEKMIEKDELDKDQLLDLLKCWRERYDIPYHWKKYLEDDEE